MCKAECAPCADCCYASQESSAPESASSPEAQAESQKVLAEVRASNPLLTKEQEQAAMERLLNKGTRSVSCLLMRAGVISLTRTRCSGTVVVLLKLREALLGIEHT